MTKFKIDFDIIKDKLPPQSPILLYPNISDNDSSIFGWIGLGGLFYLEIDDKPIFSGISKEDREYFIRDRLFPTFGQFINSLRYLVERKEAIIEFELSGYRVLTIKPANNKVLISFDNLGKEGVNIQNVQLSFKEYATEVLKTVDKYINELLDINPRLKEGKELKALVEALYKAKKTYKEQPE